MAIEALRRIQAGAEAVNGTAVPATKTMIGTLTVTPEITYHRPVDERSSLAEFRRSVKIAQRGTLRYEADATYEQIINFLAMSVKGGVAAVASGGATDARTWTYTPSLTARNNQDSYTFEYGDEQQVWQAKFTLVNTLELSFAMDESVKLSADMVSNLPTKLAAFTPNIDDPDVNEITTNSCKIYIDGDYASVGTTLKSDLVVGGTVRLATGVMPRQRLDGSFDYARFSEQRRHLEIDLDLVSNADGITEYDAWAENTPRAVRIEFEGPEIETGHDYGLQIDCFGKYTTNPNLFDAADGENMFRLSLSSHDDGEGNEFGFLVTNKETAL